MFPPRSAYLHIPFCHRRCFYCDFAVVPLGDRAGSGSGQPGAASIARYLTLLRREIAASPPGPPLSTVYLGGGTPSLLSPAQVGGLLESLAARYGLASGAEISLELDPASFDQQRLAGYLAAGINRVSLGGQSFDDAVLSSLGRRHRRSDLLAAIAWLRAAQQRGRLASWSLDLIEALPACEGHSEAPDLAHWRHQLQQAIASGAPHLSIYGLSVEPGTVFGKRAERHALILPSDDLAADQHELTSQQLAAAGYGRYEISNHAQPGHASRHNRAYWSGANWWAFGLGATSATGGQRLARPRTRDAYTSWVEALEQRPERRLSVPSRSCADQAEATRLPLDERLLVGLRRREGVAMETLLRQAGLGRTHQQDLQALLEPERQQGLLLIEGPRWRLSAPAGLALSNAVLVKLLSWWERVGPPPTGAGPAGPAGAG
ncbi:MAG: radical SAM protein [Cyanobacteria bacterium M_surface_7_m2_040]|nr:radical SAM protein [Cyanobacteria bacterium M_surface_7_m2_040]